VRLPWSTDLRLCVAYAGSVRCPPLPVDDRDSLQDSTGVGKTNSSICGFTFLLMQFLLLVGLPGYSGLHIFFVQVDSSCRCHA
jgi:hypothetical protein